MLISLNWIKRGLEDINISDDELIKLIGARLVEVEDVIDQTHKYDKIYAVRVESAEPIEGTHLSLCKINDNHVAEDVVRDDDGFVQVMCGAPNVAAGMMAAWIAPGAIVPSTFGTDEPFTIGMRKMLKKYDSYGMMAGADELDFGDDHTGIVELNPADAHPGQPIHELFLDLNDKILDIENKSLTHRPDTFGILGFRREVAGILGQKHISPDWMLEPEPTFANDPSIKLDIETDTELCPRYTAVVLEVKPKWPTKYVTNNDTVLVRSGMRPIDPIVDLTNICMLGFGQPLHAFDYDKFVQVGGTENPKIIVRAAKPGEKLILLDGKEIEMNADDIVITSNNIPVALAGAMGGANTAIDASTKRVILESATFSLYNLRKTQMAHGIFSEAITRFTKGQPAGQTLPVALRFVENAKPYLTPLALFDTQKKEPDPVKVELTLAQINNLLGSSFTINEVKRTLENVEFQVKLGREKVNFESRHVSLKVEDANDDEITVTVPFWRTDIHIAEDVIEEVGRLNGFDNITPVLPLHATSDPNPMFALKTQIRNHLASCGANELLTYSFVHGDLMKKVGQDPDNSYKIVNSISPELQHIRQTIVPSLLDKTYANIRAGHPKFALFEMNQVYPRTNGADEDGVPQNSYNLGFIYADGENKTNYYIAKKYLENLLETLGIKYMIRPFEPAKDDTNAYYEPKRSATIYAGDRILGHLGEIKQRVLREFKLSAGTAAFELDLNVILEHAESATRKDFRISQYPAVSRDVTLTVPLATDYASLESQIRAIFTGKSYIYKLRCTSIYRPDGADTKNVSFHLDFANLHKTLEKSEINAIMTRVESIK